MALPVLIGIAVGLAMDAFAVSIAVSATLRKVSPRHVFRLAYHFGLFQALMPVIGWAGGRAVAAYIQSWDHWAAFALLSVIGVKAVRESMHSDGDERPRGDPTRGWSLVALSVATSIDALAVGLSFAFLKVQIWYAAGMIGIIAGGATVIGMLLGSRAGSRLGPRMEMVGGVTLIAIGLKIVIDHLG